MASPQPLEGIRRLESALLGGDGRLIRRVLLEFGDDERAALEERIGPAAVARAYDTTRRATRARVRGKVVLIHGIMGGGLDVTADNDTDNVWLNYKRLALGRLTNLRLAVTGESPSITRQVSVSGLLAEYLPTIAELTTQWDVLPFAYDWRDDLDKAADALAARVSAWRQDAPVHIVAHSMGGLVARAFIRRHAELWKAMKDRDGLARGGRLVMLGTPNHGSFSIPLVLSGEEKTVKLLALTDLRHSKTEVLDIIGTFLGCYQMLPSPRLAFGDDRLKLWSSKTWGALPVRSSHLTRAKHFHEELFPVVDPARMIYVAGYDRPTPYRIRVDNPGKFSYQETRDGDGRVPYELGVLKDVKTLFVAETHGDLQRNDLVLAGLHELLTNGDTSLLDHSRPSTRAVPTDGEWKRGDEMEMVPAEIVATMAKPISRGRKRSSTTLTTVQQARVESAIVSSFLGGGTVTRGEGRAPVAREWPKESTSQGPRPALRLEVVWGDIAQAKGDVYACGHYENVLPAAAEWALDGVVSPASGSTRVLTDLTRRGVLRGSLGDIYFYPWASALYRHRLVAIAGMGRPGTLGPYELRILARNLTVAVASLGTAKTICTVLIGAGNGNLHVENALEAMIAGLVSALPSSAAAHAVAKIRIVEYQLPRAAEIQSLLSEVVSRHQDKVAFSLGKEVIVGRGGGVSDETALMGVLAAAATAAADRGKSSRGRALRSVLRSLPPATRELSERALVRLAPHGTADVRDVAGRVGIQIAAGRRKDEPVAPTRIAMVESTEGLTVSAISETAVIPVRSTDVDRTLVEEVVRDMTDPPVGRVNPLSKLFSRLVLPRDFRDLLKASGSFVFEVDRYASRLHWEMIADDALSEDAKPLALEHPVARQLRTQYSPPPTPDRPETRPLSALVIGDPGDPEKGESLPGAAHEATQVVDILQRLGVSVHAYIGAPREGQNLRVDTFPRPAKRLDVLETLITGGYDILHYAGHGAWDPQHPSRAGWVFKGGLLSARELERIDFAPRLVVANACVSGLMSGVTREGKLVDAIRDANLAPALADEFFRRGVRNYIGTAWEIDDMGAVDFAREFYEALLGPSPQSVGQALLAARRKLYAQTNLYQSLWAAYQHYGDPSVMIAIRSQPGRAASVTRTEEGGRTSRSIKKSSRAKGADKVSKSGRTRR